MTTIETRAEGELFDRLYRAYHRPLLRFLARMTRCPERAEDLAQVAWLKLLQARARGLCAATDDGELRAYLFTVARNAFLDEYTRKHESLRARPTEPSQLEALSGRVDALPGPEEDAARDQTQARLVFALGSLPDEQRRVIVLWMAGTSIKDMAAACRAPTDTVLSRKKYAVARMRRSLADLAGACA
jgi:RNA polymerase sigma-70 factor (ECF subfamily)